MTVNIQECGAKAQTSFSCALQKCENIPVFNLCFWIPRLPVGNWARSVKMLNIYILHRLTSQSTEESQMVSEGVGGDNQEVVHSPSSSHKSKRPLHPSSVLQVTTWTCHSTFLHTILLFYFHHIIHVPVCTFLLLPSIITWVPPLTFWRPLFVSYQFDCLQSACLPGIFTWTLTITLRITYVLKFPCPLECFCLQGTKK